MFRTNPLRFASQPDDFLTELSVIEKFKPEKVLVAAAGGCNFLNLVASKPEVEFNCFDSDIVEIEHLKCKVSALKRGDFDRLNYLSNEQEGLNQSGKYESLLRIVRRFIYEFVVEHDSFNARLWSADEEERLQLLQETFESPAWQRAFPMFFSKGSLETLLGGIWAEDSCKRVQHNIESLLKRNDYRGNWFLKHFLVGEYDEEARPPYMEYKSWEKQKDFQFYSENLWDIPLESYNMISLSAYGDFLNKEERGKLVAHLKKNLQTGAVVILRTLKESDPVRSALEPEFYVDQNWGEELLSKDRSFLFSHQAVAIKE